ncbi:alpha,alpha-trehalose-phosphate synthase (UDP-forming) [Shimia ponticola]|uniref:alpha,alpha-trehalose-phosphate synthase (UDP-forming) n=1 Tax=Shimia ponticola TaxID=2582893 RepID=UPI0011BDA0FE|nr:trehalose-6-phosphate synthase [Shimia ponticola]
MSQKGGRLIVISNRIPTDETPSGGLVVALHEALTERGGIWIGSSGGPQEAPREGLTQIASGAYSRYAFDLSHADYEQYYLGYANSVLWPLFHRRADLINVQPGMVEGYMAVNERLAKMVAEIAQPGDLIWVHDYHFLPLAAALRALGVDNRVGFFLHIPFPTASDVPALPQADDMLDWVAAYDVFGMQTETDVQRLDALAARVEGKVNNGRAFPIGIDPVGYRDAAIASAAGDNMALSLGQKLIIGVDRLDYSKGLVHRFEGFGAYLAQRQDSDPKATLLQIAPPSRENVDAYQDIRAHLESTAGALNGEYAELDWTPIRYIRRNVARERLAGVMRRADVGLVTPLADGMNLVAKEFVAAQDPDDPGVLILSSFAGAAEQMQDALIVNPYDATEMGDAIQKALSMSLDERKARHAALLDGVQTQDIHWWTQSCLDALAGERVWLRPLATWARTLSAL